MITAICTTADPPYDWLTTLLLHSLRRCGQPGPIVILTDVIDAGYPPINRPYALDRWLSQNPEIEECVLILDVDTVLRRPLQREVSAGRAIAQRCRYANVFEAERHLLTEVPWQLQYLMMPYIVHSSDLRRFAARWFQWTRHMQNRPGWVQAGSKGGRTEWVPEMWGYMIATAEAGIAHAEDATLMCSIADPDDGSSPVVHLTYSIASFDKRRYEPWKPIPRGYHAGLNYVADLVDELRDCRVDPCAAFGA
jgi:hypothetical protein